MLGLGLFFCTGYIQMLIILVLNIKKITAQNSVIISTLSSTVILLILMLLYRKELVNEFKIYKKNLNENIDIGIKYWLIGLLGMMVSNIIINLVFGTSQAENEQAVQKMISALPYLMVLSAGIIAPINEEILFRKIFRNNIKNNILFILISGIFFGFLHVSQTSTLQQFLYIIPYSCLGISFAIMYVKTKSVFTSTFMHMFHNTVLTILSIII